MKVSAPVALATGAASGSVQHRAISKRSVSERFLWARARHLKRSRLAAASQLFKLQMVYLSFFFFFFFPDGCLLVLSFSMLIALSANHLWLTLNVANVL